jgi:hypothetical protein
LYPNTARGIAEFIIDNSNHLSRTMIGDLFARKGVILIFFFREKKKI